MFGEGLTKILKQVAALRNKDVTAKAKQYGLNMKIEKDRLQAAEEVLAELAQTNPQSGFAQRGRTAAQGAIAGAFSCNSRNDIDRELAGLTRNIRTARGPNLVKSAAESFIGKPLENAETGVFASVTKQSLGKMLHATAMDYSVSRAAHYEAIANIDKLFRLATKGDSRPGVMAEDTNNIAAIHHFDVPMPYKGEILHVEMLVKEFTKPDKLGHRIFTSPSPL